MDKFRVALFFLIFLPALIFGAEMVDINSASLAQLDTLAGIGPEKSQIIIDARPFSSVDDLLKVKGIGPATLEKIKDQGLAYVGNPPTSQPMAPPEAESQAETPKPIENSSQELSNGEKGENKGNGGALSYPTGIFINEILPSPDGPDETEEWIEFKNTNSQEVVLAGWEIKDTSGTIKTYKFPAGSKISGYSFLVLSRPVSKISLNNTGDGLMLLWPNGQIVDQVSYEKALLGQSWNRAKAGWAWSAVLTSGKDNIISQPVAAQGKPFDAAQGKQTKKAPIGASFQETAAVGAPIEELLASASTANQGIFSFDWPTTVFFFALGSAILSAIAVLLLKKFLHRNRSTT